MYNSKWIIGKDYYEVKDQLEKQGFTKTSDCGYYNKEKTKGYQEFDNGVETIILKCNIQKDSNGHLQCGTIYDFKNKIYDNKKSMSNKKDIYECIMANVAKEVKKALNETSFIAPDFILDDVIDDEYLNRLAIKFVRETDMRDYKNLVKKLCGEYVDKNTIRRNTQYSLAYSIYGKLKDIAVYDLDKIEELSPATNDIEKSANEYIYLRSQDIQAAYEFIQENRDILYDITVENAYRQFIKYVFEFLRDMYI